MMKVWTIAAQKGGVGKTTSVVSIAGTLSRHGYKVLMVDLDPHGSLSGYFGFNCDVVEPNAYGLFESVANNDTSRIDDFIQRDLTTPGLSLIPSSTSLVSLDRRYGQRKGMGGILRRCLQGVNDDFDYCLIDCPPMLGILVVNALVCCQSLIVPVQTEFMAVESVDRLLRTLEMIQRSVGLSVPYTVVPTMYDRRTRAARDSLQRLRRRRDIIQWDDVIPVDTQFREASRIGVPLTCWQPLARGSLAYQQLVSALSGSDELERMRLAG